MRCDNNRKMVCHSWKKLEGFPVIFGIVFAIGIFLPFIIALANRRVTPFVPYISEGGGYFPEAGIFSMCMVFTCLLSQCIIFLRYLVAEEKINKTGNDLDIFLNKMSIGLGSLSTLAVIVVSSYPSTSIPQVHNSAAGVACVCLVLYLICHTWITYRMRDNSKLARIRLCTSVCSAVAMILIGCFGVLGSYEWTADHSVGKKTPGDKGFVYYLLSASAEWILAIIFFIFYATYIPDFKNFEFHFHMQARKKNTPRISTIHVENA